MAALSMHGGAAHESHPLGIDVQRAAVDDGYIDRTVAHSLRVNRHMTVSADIGSQDIPAAVDSYNEVASVDTLSNRNHMQLSFALEDTHCHSALQCLWHAGMA